MNKTRTSFIFSSSLLSAIDKLPAELKGEFMVAIANYAIHGEEPHFFDLAEVIWNLIRDIVERDNLRRDSAQRNLRSKKQEKKEEDNDNTDDGNDGAQDEDTRQSVPATQTEQDNQFLQPKQNAGSSLCNTNEKFVSHKEKVCVTQTADTENKPEKADFENKGGTIGGDNIPTTIRKERLPTGVQRKETLSDAPIGATHSRKLKFGVDVWEYRNKYTREMLKAFYDYWSEENRSGVKMRFEMEKTWQLGRRLAVWANRDKQYGRQPFVSPTKPEAMENIMAHVRIEPEKSEEEKKYEAKQKYLFFIQKVDTPSMMSKGYRQLLTEAYNNGELQRCGISWHP